MTEPRVRSVRSDSVRNRAKVLEAAREQITAHGPGVGMDAIAAAAGVAVGTLYRHFPTKTDLVAAVVSAFVTRVADRFDAAVVRVEEGSPAFVELQGLLRDVVQTAATDQAAKAAAVALGAVTDDSAAVLRAHRALGRLVDAAKADGAVRPDLSVDDFYLLIGNAPADPSPAVVGRWVDLVLFGLVGPAPDRSTAGG